jgi:hypothetical protein
MKPVSGLLIVLFVLTNCGDLLAVDGFKEYKFGLSFEQAKKIGVCQWKKQDVDFRGFMIIGNKNADLYRCSNYAFDGRNSELYLEFVNNSLQRIILDISGDEQTNLKTLERFKKQYGYEKEGIFLRGRSKQYLFDDESVELELYEPPLNLMYLRFYSKNYRQLIKQPYLPGETT